jgi:hypothetical protein
MCFLKFSFFIIIIICLMAFTSSDNPVNKECKCKDIPLFGKVRIVTSLATFKVKVVEYLPDLNVQVVESLPQSCGQWQFVSSLEDFTIMYVDALA